MGIREYAYNTGLAKVAVQCSADTFVVNQSLVLRINPAGAGLRKSATTPSRKTLYPKQVQLYKPKTEYFEIISF